MKGELKHLKPRADVDHDAHLKSVEKWLADRREDDTMKISGLAIVSVYADGSIGTSYRTGNNMWTLLGALRQLELRIERENDDS